MAPIPLPYAASWCSGEYAKPEKDYAPMSQIQLIRQGHHLMPTFFSWNLAKLDDARLTAYYHDGLTAAAKLKLPITVSHTQWEWLLIRRYRKSPAAGNPCVVRPDGTVRGVLSPFGPVEKWRELGKEWAAYRGLKLMQKLYPAPPFVVMLSNNECPKLSWHEVEQSQRYLEKYGKGRSAEFKRKVVGDGFIERYKALIEAFRAGLGYWKERAIFTGYNTGIACVGRWDGWINYADTIPGRFTIAPFIWDGGSPEYYVNAWQHNSDGWTGYCSQVAQMNYVWQKKWFQQIHPGFYWEMSTWFDQKWIKKMQQQGQQVPPERYRGYIGYGMWLVRPRAVRHFTWKPICDAADYARFMQLVAGVDQIHANPVLREFWQFGKLVLNESKNGHPWLGKYVKTQHPYQHNLPAAYQNKPRWYALNTSLDPARPYDVSPGILLDLKFKVWALARVLGEKPNRRWLVYAHAPLGPEKDVEIEIPDFGNITMNVTTRGRYALITEATRTTQTIGE